MLTAPPAWSKRRFRDAPARRSILQLGKERLWIERRRTGRLRPYSAGSVVHVRRVQYEVDSVPCGAGLPSGVGGCVPVVPTP
jgi:hypothetical protein